jgi:hypothetical protein
VWTGSFGVVVGKLEGKGIGLGVGEVGCGLDFGTADEVCSSSGSIVEFTEGGDGSGSIVGEGGFDGGGVEASVDVVEFEEEV